MRAIGSPRDCQKLTTLMLDEIRHYANLDDSQVNYSTPLNSLRREFSKKGSLHMLHTTLRKLGKYPYNLEVLTSSDDSRRFWTILITNGNPHPTRRGWQEAFHWCPEVALPFLHVSSYSRGRIVTYRRRVWNLHPNWRPMLPSELLSFINKE